MVWTWMFLDGGNRVGMISGPTHGTNAGQYQLYDTASGKLLAEVHADETGELKANAPVWARDLDARMRNPRPAN